MINFDFDSNARSQTANYMEAPIRILHVLGGMDCGGAETWLMHVLRHIDRQQFRMDFLVHTDRRCFYDEEIKSLGSRIHFCPTPSNPLRYRKNFLCILHENGPYDIVHSHVHHFSGFVLRLAKEAGISRRIAHSHNDTTKIDSGVSPYRRFYLRTGRRWVQRYASMKLAASKMAADCLYGSAWQSDFNTKVLYCGLNFEAFKQSVDSIALREELGFLPGDFIIGNVSRFAPQKNHDLLLRVHAEILKTQPRARLLLIGKGPLEASIRAIAERLGTAEHIRFTGVRADVARLMLGAMDVFVLPSLYEGLGLVAIEAQAAGLPTILSDGIPPEADLSTGLVRFIPLQKPVTEWAQTILSCSKRELLQKADALAHATQSQFSIQRSTEALCHIYTKAA